MFGNDKKAVLQLVGRKLREERLRNGWSLEEVARRMAYTKKVAKGIRRIMKAEETGTGGKEFVNELAGALGLSVSGIEQEIRAQVQREQEEWLSSWLEQHPKAPVASHMIIRLLPGFYGPHQLPTPIQTPKQAVAYARTFAQQHHHKVCLPLTPTISVYFDTDGKIMGLADA